MNIYEKEFYGRDIPGIKKALERIADALEVIISDPGDEVEHIAEVHMETDEEYVKRVAPLMAAENWPPNPAQDIEGAKEWAKDYLKRAEGMPDDYKMD